MTGVSGYGKFLSVLTKAVAVAAVAVVASSQAFAAGVVSPGKNSAYASATGVAIPVGGSFLPAVDVQISKGKKKRVLEVDVTIIDTSAVTHVIAAVVSVNGVLMEPGMFQLSSSTLTAAFWLDLDAAEAANPGMFNKQPLNIQTEATSLGTPAVAAVSVRARLVKK